MFTIEKNTDIYVINKSKFITNIFYVDNIEDVENYLNMIKNEYKDATHNCYAYIIDNLKRFNDDKEPNGTAGKPILDCLEKNNLNHVLCIVTRYFGGIKLGANGLLRAYSTSTSNAINSAIKYELVNGFEVNISFDYSKTKEIDKILEKSKIINKSFDTKVIYKVEIDNDTLDKLQNLVNIDSKKEIIIKKQI